MSLIGPENYSGLLTILLGLVWFGFWTERNPLMRKLPGVLWILLIATTLSNTGIIPLKSPVYSFISAYVMPLAIPLLLFKATFGKIMSESGKVLPIFFVGAVAVCIGAIIGFYLLDLGPLGPHLAATYAASWIGGVTDMVAMAEITKFPTEDFGIAVSASAPVSIIGLAILVALPSIPFVRRLIPSKIADEVEAKEGKSDDGEDELRFDLVQIGGALALSAVICWVGNWAAGAMGFANYTLFAITLITVLLANVFAAPMRAIRGDFELGMFAMYLFFVAIFAEIDLSTFVTRAPVYFVFGTIMILVHVAIVLLFARFLKYDLAEAIIGSGANIVGAAAAAGIASSKGWKRLVTPAIATGMLGKAIAPFFGIALFKMLS